MKSKTDILAEFALFSMPAGGGIGSWLTEKAHSDVFERLGRIDEEPLSAVQLNQLLVMGHEAPLTSCHLGCVGETRPTAVWQRDKISGRSVSARREVLTTKPIYKISNCGSH